MGYGAAALTLIMAMILAHNVQAQTQTQSASGFTFFSGRGAPSDAQTEVDPATPSAALCVHSTSPCDRVNDGRCWKCRNGMYMQPGLNCVDCEKGRYRADVTDPHNTYVQCTPGHYADQTQRVGCKECPKGFSVSPAH